MRSSLCSSVALLALPVLVSPAGEPRPGEEAPPIETKSWLNHFGKAPLLETLRGRAVLIEFWATT